MAESHHPPAKTTLRQPRPNASPQLLPSKPQHHAPITTPMASSDYGELPTDLLYPECDAFPPSTQDFFPPPSTPPIPFSEALHAIEEVKKEQVEKKVKEGKVILFETRWPNCGYEEELKVIETPTKPSAKRKTPTEVEREVPESIPSSPISRPQQDPTMTPQRTPIVQKPKLKVELTTSPFPSSPPTPLLSHPRPNRRLAEQFSRVAKRKGPKRKPPERGGEGLEGIEELPEFADDMKVVPRKRCRVSRGGEGAGGT
ncbi:hypothetical protein BJ508DRAFT_157683 [Ascobolus immersus RN42]|uniref:Uncharacterized protein n=1 Tax=Ascobolus immersus RN42 TaxID=1160509 RepID=A0A3N4IIF8_ASCIM|nr:hypothetical protein BJ508DRAFT_157683 [Ascobolus immersus RN42]